MMRLPPIATPSDSEAVASNAAANDIALGTPEMPTVGSIEHAVGNCRPCAFFHKRGCENGVQCKFCHLCDPGEKRRRQKEKKAQFREQQEGIPEPGRHAAGDMLPPVAPAPALQLSATPAAPVGSPVLRRPPAAIVLDDEEDVLDRVTNALPLNTPQQPWPATPAECWPPTPADNHRPSCISFGANLGGFPNTNTLFSAPMTTAATLGDQSQRSWQVATLPPLQQQHFSFAPAATIAALSENQRPPPVLRLAESLLDPVLGSAELPSAGSRTHRFGNCRPCAFLHKQGCGNGLHCEFCHLCDPGEKKRRQKLKKVQLQNVKQEAESLISIGCLD
jgi:hypothetical protein